MFYFAHFLLIVNFLHEIIDRVTMAAYRIDMNHNTLALGGVTDFLY